MQPPVARNADDFDDLIGKWLGRFRRVGFTNIPRFADSCCEALGIHEYPRDPRDYLPLLGVDLERATLGAGVNAIWLRTGNMYRVQYSPHLGSRIGLVLWHEFFEIISSHPRFPSRLSVDSEEKLATLFAVHVMMPEGEVRRQAADLRHPQGANKSRVMASRFGVSHSAMSLRLRQLGLEHPASSRRDRYD